MFVLDQCAWLAGACRVHDRNSLYQLGAGGLALMFGAGGRLLAALDRPWAVLEAQQMALLGLMAVLDTDAQGGRGEALCALYRTVAKPAAFLSWLARAGRLLALRAPGDHLAGTPMRSPHPADGNLRPFLDWVCAVVCRSRAAQGTAPLCDHTFPVPSR